MHEQLALPNVFPPEPVQLPLFTPDQCPDGKSLTELLAAMPVACGFGRFDRFSPEPAAELPHGYSAELLPRHVRRRDPLSA